MRYQDLKRHLKPYSIVAKRTTTITHAFASAVAPCDDYDPAVVQTAIRDLEQDPDADLRCAYCDGVAETWDHVHATVRGKRFSGYGHRLGNLLPCCKPCNSKKGNKPWSDFLASLQLPESIRLRRQSIIEAYLARYRQDDSIPDMSPEYAELERLQAQVMDLLQEADVLASRLRASRSSHSKETQYAGE